MMTTDDKHSDDSSGTDENISGGREDTLSFYKLCFDFFIELLLLQNNWIVIINSIIKFIINN